MKLKELREQEKISQTQLAKKLNMPLITYTRYENGIREPNIETLIKLADFYNVSLDYLVDRKFKNELGYLNEFDYNFIKSYLNLTQAQKMFIAGTVYAETLNL